MPAKKLNTLILMTVLMLVLGACGRESDSTTTVSRSSNSARTAACFSDGVSHASGTSWKCSDGCNTCSCKDGLMSSTLKYCGG